MIGTGDLSELALGWATYGVGDQMSHYAVNASVPKTLITFMLRWVIDTGQFDADVNAVLQSVLDTEISPELIPADGDKPTADSESKVGPYEIQDFFLYYILRYGHVPSKVAFLAEHAWGDVERGPWPDLIPPDRRNAYSRAEIKHWLGVFLFRFFQISQFKRTAIPNAPKVGLGRLALAARRLARAERRARDGVARRATPERARLGALDELGELRPLGGLLDEAVDVGTQARQLLLAGRCAGVHQHGDLAQVAQALERLPAVELGHPHVEHHEVGPDLVERAQAAPAVLGGDDLMARPLQLHAQHEGEIGRVVDDQDARHPHMMWNRRRKRDPAKG